MIITVYSHYISEMKYTVIYCWPLLLESNYCIDAVFMVGLQNGLMELSNTFYMSNSTVYLKYDSMFLAIYIVNTYMLYIYSQRIGWLVDFGFNGPLRQYFSPYRAVSQREGDRGEKRQKRVKMSKQPLTRTYCKRNRSLPNYDPNCRTFRHWKFTQGHHTTW